MICKTSYADDSFCYFQINNDGIPKEVHVHVVNEDNTIGIVQLEFVVLKNLVFALIPANLEFISTPELVVELNDEKRKNFKTE